MSKCPGCGAFAHCTKIECSVKATLRTFECASCEHRFTSQEPPHAWSEFTIPLPAYTGPVCRCYPNVCVCPKVLP